LNDLECFRGPPRERKFLSIATEEHGGTPPYGFPRRLRTFLGPMAEGKGRTADPARGKLLVAVMPFPASDGAVEGVEDGIGIRAVAVIEINEPGSSVNARRTRCREGFVPCVGVRSADSSTTIASESSAMRC
jgi:hypothetical protein